MTKEEILSRKPQYSRLSFGLAGGDENEYTTIRGAQEAMDEYAKLFGEKLIGWLNDNDFKPNGFKDNMQSDYVNNGERMHASEIVDLFIEQQNK